MCKLNKKSVMEIIVVKIDSVVFKRRETGKISSLSPEFYEKNDEK